MVKNLPNIVLDTNVFISSIVFGGKPRAIIKLITENKIVAVISPPLLAELLEILTKKFQFHSVKIQLVQELIKENFILVYPSKTLHVVSDEDDNRVLEAAMAGACRYIVTGDKDLLDIKKFKNIAIVKPNDFLLELKN